MEKHILFKYNFNVVPEAEQIITLAQVFSGNLEGKFLMYKQFNLAKDLSKCVSTNFAFGKKMVINKVTLLIADKLDPNILVATDTWLAFRNMASTICQGRQFSL